MLLYRFFHGENLIIAIAGKLSNKLTFTFFLGKLKFVPYPLLLVTFTFFLRKLKFMRYSLLFLITHSPHYVYFLPLQI